MLSPNALPAVTDGDQGVVRSFHRRSFINTTTERNKPVDILTKDQKLAFKEIFDLFDSNGGGSIDADELNEALSSADIHLTREEITEVLSSMDKDGNGEIDFEEFLQLMTNTERFLESVTCKDSEQSRQREVLLFEALTQFMKKSALHSINEIVGYYHNKYKRVQAPHVIRHYAAGARLIGLSEQQIRRHLDKIRRSSSDNTSPYAQPPYTFSGISLVRNKDDGVKLAKIPEGEASETKIREKLKLLVPEQTSTAKRGRIRLKVIWEKKDEEKGTKHVVDVNRVNIKEPHPTQQTHPKTKTKYNGWIAQRFNPGNVHEHLPVLTTGIMKQQILKEQRKLLCTANKMELNFDDMSGLRGKAKNLSNLYYVGVQTEKSIQADKHWSNLAVDEIPSRRLQRSFKRAFNAYVDYRNTPISSLGSNSIA